MSEPENTSVPPEADTLPQPDGSGTSVPSDFDRARSASTYAAKRIKSKFLALTLEERRRVGRAFLSTLAPSGSRGRKRRKEITAAHADWKNGMRGPELFEKHIPGFKTMSQWKRRVKKRALIDAIRSRERRGRIL